VRTSIQSRSDSCQLAIDSCTRSAALRTWPSVAFGTATRRTPPVRCPTQSSGDGPPLWKAPHPWSRYHSGSACSTTLQNHLSPRSLGAANGAPKPTARLVSTGKQSSASRPGSLILLRTPRRLGRHMMDTGKLNLVSAIGTSQDSQTDMTPSARPPGRWDETRTDYPIRGLAERHVSCLFHAPDGASSSPTTVMAMAKQKSRQPGPRQGDSSGAVGHRR